MTWAASSLKKLLRATLKLVPDCAHAACMAAWPLCQASVPQHRAHAHGAHDQGCILHASGQAGEAVQGSCSWHHACGADVADGGLDAHAAVHARWHPPCTGTSVRPSMTRWHSM